MSAAFIHESAYIDEPSSIGADTKIWHFVHVLSNAEIGENCVLGQNIMVGSYVKIGNNCKIQNNVALYRGVAPEDGVFCGPSCVFTNVMTPRAEVGRKDEFGANATIVCGNTLGAYCLIAAGAVVTRDVPDYALVVGVSARRIGWVSRTGDCLDDDLTCPRTGEKYQETNGVLRRIED